MYYLFIVEFAEEDQTCFFFVRMKLSYAIAKCIFKVFIVRILALVGVTLVVSDILRNWLIKHKLIETRVKRILWSSRFFEGSFMPGCPVTVFVWGALVEQTDMDSYFFINENTLKNLWYYLDKQNAYTLNYVLKWECKKNELKRLLLGIHPFTLLLVAALPTLYTN